MGYDRAFYAEVLKDGKWEALGTGYAWQKRHGADEFLEDFHNHENIRVTRKELSEELANEIGYLSSCKGLKDCSWECYPFSVVLNYMRDRFERESQDPINRIESYCKEISFDEVDKKPRWFSRYYGGTADNPLRIVKHIGISHIDQIPESDRPDWTYHNQLCDDSPPYHYQMLYNCIKELASQAGLSDLTQVRLIVWYERVCEMCMEENTL